MGLRSKECILDSCTLLDEIFPHHSVGIVLVHVSGKICFVRFQKNPYPGYYTLVSCCQSGILFLWNLLSDGYSGSLQVRIIKQEKPDKLKMVSGMADMYAS